MNRKKIKTVCVKRERKKKAEEEDEGEEEKEVGGGRGGEKEKKGEKKILWFGSCICRLANPKSIAQARRLETKGVLLQS